MVTGNVQPAAPRLRRPHPAHQRGSLAGWLLKWCGVALLTWLLATATPVLLLRWLRPLTSAFMLEARTAAWRAQDYTYHSDFRWVSLEQISAHAAIAVIASEDQGFYTPGGLYKPDIQLFNWGRVFFLEHFGENKQTVQRRAKFVGHVGQELGLVLGSESQLLGPLLHGQLGQLDFPVLAFDG